LATLIEDEAIELAVRELKQAGYYNILVVDGYLVNFDIMFWL